MIRASFGKTFDLDKQDPYHGIFFRAWGNNVNRQLGLDSDLNGIHVPEPTLVPEFADGSKNIRQISAGSNHSAAWTSPALTPDSAFLLGLPSRVPDKFEGLKGKATFIVLNSRFIGSIVDNERNRQINILIS